MERSAPPAPGARSKMAVKAPVDGSKISALPTAYTSWLLSIDDLVRRIGTAGDDAADEQHLAVGQLCRGVERRAAAVSRESTQPAPPVALVPVTTAVV